MTYKTALINQGFNYSDEYGLFIKSLGFGQKITVEKPYGAQFTCKRNSRGHLGDGEVVFDKEVKSLKEFKQLISTL